MEQAPATPRERVLTVPNALSVVRLVLIGVFLYLLLVVRADAWATGILMFSGASDWADGKIARLMNQSSRLGELLDPLVDRIYIGKAATFGLMSGFPLILLGQFGALWSRVVLAIGWGFLIWGLAMYLWSFVLYVVQFVMVLRRLPKIDTEGRN